MAVVSKTTFRQVGFERQAAPVSDPWGEEANMGSSLITPNHCLECLYTEGHEGKTKVETRSL